MDDNTAKQRHVSEESVIGRTQQILSHASKTLSDLSANGSLWDVPLEYARKKYPMQSPSWRIFVAGANWQKERIKADIIAEMETFIYHHLNCVGDIQCDNVEALIADMKGRIELLTESK